MQSEHHTNSISPQSICLLPIIIADSRKPCISVKMSSTPLDAEKIKFCLTASSRTMVTSRPLQFQQQPQQPQQTTVGKKAAFFIIIINQNFYD